LNALLLVPAMREHATSIAAVSLVLALVTVGCALFTGVSTGEKVKATTPPAPAAAAPPSAAPPAPTANQAEAEVVALFALLQEKGRFVDFLMDDVTAYDDAQVGAAARVVHQGCRPAPLRQLARRHR